MWFSERTSVCMQGKHSYQVLPGANLVPRARKKPWERGWPGVPEPLACYAFYVLLLNCTKLRGFRLAHDAQPPTWRARVFSQGVLPLATISCYLKGAGYPPFAVVAQLQYNCITRAMTRTCDIRLGGRAYDRWAFPGIYEVHLEAPVHSNRAPYHPSNPWRLLGSPR